ncbi:protein translocase subunit SecF [Candidatus Poriferisodalis sp.]|uniref:protein translocase subunit SecF n=1 Tax=Candidatus Poriferisodalis sp. TaxID=3101277 RepID=UPI003B012ECB
MIAALRTFYRGENSWDVLRLARKVLIGSAVAVLVCVVALLARGLNLGIEFEGGSVWEIPVNAPSGSADEATDADADAGAGADDAQADADADDAETAQAGAGSGDGSGGATAPGLTTDDVAAAAAAAGVPDARVQFVVVTGSEDIFRVRGVLGPGADGAAVAQALADAVGVDVERLSSRQVSPSFGDAVAGKARRALVVFFVLIALYLWFRFEWKMSVGALVAVAHDIVLTVGAYALFGFEVTPATVVAFLTIMGYSLYDTIVVFDRVKTNERSLPARSHFTYHALANVSLNQVLTRSVNTSVTSVLPVLSLLVVGAGFLGAGTLAEFATALLIGLLVGSYSSIFVAMPVVAWLKGHEPGWAGAQVAADAAGRYDSMEVAAQALAAESYTRSAPPRPRKKGRRR